MDRRKHPAIITIIQRLEALHARWSVTKVLPAFRDLGLCPNGWNDLLQHKAPTTAHRTYVISPRLQFAPARLLALLCFALDKAALPAPMTRALGNLGCFFAPHVNHHSTLLSPSTGQVSCYPLDEAQKSKPNMARPYSYTSTLVTHVRGH